MDFQVRVRTRTFLWGGEGVTRNLEDPLTPDIFLSFRSDRNGDTITYVQQMIGQDSKVYSLNTGQLAPGESFTLKLNASSGVYVEIPPNGISTVVNCSIHGGR